MEAVQTTLDVLLKSPASTGVGLAIAAFGLTRLAQSGSRAAAAKKAALDDDLEASASLLRKAPVALPPDEDAVGTPRRRLDFFGEGAAAKTPAESPASVSPRSMSMDDLRDVFAVDYKSGDAAVRAVADLLSDTVFVYSVGDAP